MLAIFWYLVRLHFTPFHNFDFSLLLSLALLARTNVKVNVIIFIMLLTPLWFSVVIQNGLIPHLSTPRGHLRAGDFRGVAVARFEHARSPHGSVVDWAHGATVAGHCFSFAVPHLTNSLHLGSNSNNNTFLFRIEGKSPGVKGIPRWKQISWKWYWQHILQPAALCLRVYLHSLGMISNHTSMKRLQYFSS